MSSIQGSKLRCVGGCISSLGNLVQFVPLELFDLHVEKHWMDFDGCVSLSFEE